MPGPGSDGPQSEGRGDSQLEAYIMGALGG